MGNCVYMEEIGSFSVQKQMFVLWNSEYNIMEAFIGKLCTSVEVMSFCMLELNLVNGKIKIDIKKHFTMQFFPKQ